MRRRKHPLSITSLLALTLATLLIANNLTNLSASPTRRIIQKQDNLRLTNKQPMEIFADGTSLGETHDSKDATIISSDNQASPSSATLARDDGSDGELDEGGSSSAEIDLGDSSQPDTAANDQHDYSTSAANSFIDEHKSRVQAMQDLFERRFLSGPHQMPASQELSPISIGLDPVNGMSSPFQVPPFSVPNHDSGAQPAPPPMAKPLAAADHIDQGMGPALPFPLGPLPQLLGFQNQPFDGAQQGDQPAHSNYHAAMSPTESDQSSGQKTWPKIFRFTDGRINLSDFEKQKKIRLSSKNHHNTENHIESAPIIFDGRQLKRKSFLILHGGIFSR